MFKKEIYINEIKIEVLNWIFCFFFTIISYYQSNIQDSITKKDNNLWYFPPVSRKILYPKSYK